LAYTLVVGCLRYFHEPWGDEADPWLMARDASFSEMFTISRHMGHPLLWHIIQMPFARLGFPFEAQGVIHLLIAIANAFLILRYAPFRMATKLLIIFGFLFSFQYAIVARN